MPTDVPFQEGDLVQLTSGGPVMSLQEISGNRALCMWFDELGKLEERYFLVASLRRALANDDGLFANRG